MTRIASGVTDQYIYFYAVDSTDLKTPETGLTSFTVVYSRNGAADVTYTTPTTSEIDSSTMPGVYALLLDEDMTIDSGDETQEVCLHISKAGMAPVVRTYELYRPKITAGNTLDVTATGAAGIDWGNVENKTTSNALTGTTLDLTTNSVNAVADQVWDEATNGHVAAASFGAVMQPIRSSTCQAGGSTTTVKLDSGASASDDYYNNQIIIGWVAADGTNKFADIITDYNGTTKVATVTGIPVSPDATYTFVILPFGSVPGASAPTADQNAAAVWNKLTADHTTEGSFGAAVGGEISQVGQLQSASSASAVVIDATGASATNNAYRYCRFELTSGTYAGAASYISAYTAASKAVTLDPALPGQPSTGDAYIIRKLGIDAATPANVADAIWDEARSGHTSAGTFGEYVNADTVRLSGDATAADNAEAFFDGTGYAGTNNVIPSVTTVTGNVNGNVGGNVTGSVGSVTGAVGSVTGAVGSVTGNVGGNVTGSVGSVTGAVGSVTGNVGGNVVGSVASVTGNVGGNVVGSVASVTNTVNADVKKINAVTVTGDGSGTPWGPA